MESGPFNGRWSIQSVSINSENIIFSPHCYTLLFLFLRCFIEPLKSWTLVKELFINKIVLHFIPVNTYPTSCFFATLKPFDLFFLSTLLTFHVLNHRNFNTTNICNLLSSRYSDHSLFFREKSQKKWNSSNRERRLFRVNMLFIVCDKFSPWKGNVK